MRDDPFSNRRDFTRQATLVPCLDGLINNKMGVSHKSQTPTPWKIKLALAHLSGRAARMPRDIE
jgi:hypothetical protein